MHSLKLLLDCMDLKLKNIGINIRVYRVSGLGERPDVKLKPRASSPNRATMIYWNYKNSNRNIPEINMIYVYL